ncbi:MAG TPA: hypothetical protein VFB79_18740 [Candidatus Angelobacter sp.]|nr:hypothetical protein [Candidatus Angelobacter sp.]
MTRHSHRADFVSRCAADPAFFALHSRQLSTEQLRLVIYLRDHGTFSSWAWHANSAAEKEEALRLIHFHIPVSTTSPQLANNTGQASASAGLFDEAA